MADMGDDVPVDPIWDIECPVCTEGREVVRGDRLGFACALEHEQLRKDGHGLEEDGERPKQLREREPVVEEECEDHAGADQVFDAERVYRGVVCWPGGAPLGEKFGSAGGWAHLYLTFMR